MFPVEKAQHSEVLGLDGRHSAPHLNVIIHTTAHGTRRQLRKDVLDMHVGDIVLMERRVVVAGATRWRVTRWRSPRTSAKDTSQRRRPATSTAWS